MKSQEIIERLDSLWFFSNVFTSLPPPSVITSCCNDGETTLLHLQESHIPSQPNIPTSPVVQRQELQPPETEILVQTDSKSEELIAESEVQTMKPVTVGVFEAMELLEKDLRKYRKAKRSCKRSCNRGKMSQREQNYGEVKGFNDDMAMKEHLRSWAYAVACIVR